LEVWEYPEIAETFFQAEVSEVRRSERRKVRGWRFERLKYYLLYLLAVGLQDM